MKVNVIFASQGLEQRIASEGVNSPADLLLSVDVGRLKEAEYLTRRDAEVDSHQVTLQFDRDKPLIRSSKAKPSDATLIELLKSPDWNDIGELKA